MSQDLLLDTCAVLWAGLDPDRLSAAARCALADPHARVSVASISAAEIACAVERERVTFCDHWKPWFRDALARNGWEALPATLEIVEEAYSLPEPFHRDPADRVIVATARLRGLTVVTADRLVLAYPHVRTLW